MNKRSEATQTLRAGCSKANTNNSNTNKQTYRDRGDYNTLRSLVHSVINDSFNGDNMSI